MSTGPVSYEIAQRVRQAISSKFVTASDTEVANALGVSRAAVSAWKTGRDVMSSAMLMKAHELCKFDLQEWCDYFLTLHAESAARRKDPQMRDNILAMKAFVLAYGEAMRDQAQKISKGAAGLLLAGALSWSTINDARAATPSPGRDASPGMYIMANRRRGLSDRRRRAWPGFRAVNVLQVAPATVMRRSA